MNMNELDHAMRKLRLGGMASTLEVRLIARRLKKARFRDPDKTLDGFDFGFAKKLNRKLLFELAPLASLRTHSDVLRSEQR